MPLEENAPGATAAEDEAPEELEEGLDQAEEAEETQELEDEGEPTSEESAGEETTAEEAIEFLINGKQEKLSRAEIQKRLNESDFSARTKKLWDEAKREKEAALAEKQGAMQVLAALSKEPLRAFMEMRTRQLGGDKKKAEEELVKITEEWLGQVFALQYASPEEKKKLEEEQARREREAELQRKEADLQRKEAEIRARLDEQAADEWEEATVKQIAAAGLPNSRKTIRLLQAAYEDAIDEERKITPQEACAWAKAHWNDEDDLGALDPDKLVNEHPDLVEKLVQARMRRAIQKKAEARQAARARTSTPSAPMARPGTKRKAMSSADLWQEITA